MQHEQTAAEGIHRYLVRYGLTGRVGRFGSIELIECRRGDAVVVHTDRGIEPGELLIPPGEFSAADRHAPAGELLRRMTHEDAQVLKALRARQEAIVARCIDALKERKLAIEIVDVESLLDGRTTVLYFLGQSCEELGRLSVDLATDPRQRVRFEPLLLPDAVSGEDERQPDEVPDAPEGQGSDMKGPFERLKYDLRRVWECPSCKRRERTDGTVTFRFCNCTAKGETGRPTNMKLVDDAPRHRFPTRPRWPRLPEEIAASESQSPMSPPATSAKPVVELPAAPVPPPSDPAGPPNVPPQG